MTKKTPTKTATERQLEESNRWLGIALELVEQLRADNAELRAELAQIKAELSDESAGNA